MELAKAQILKTIHEEVLRCERCSLYKGRTHAVPGDGPADAEIIFIGEAPGFHEDQQGVPFVGAAGKLLNKLLEQAGIDRRKVYITNVIKCRPPGNRDPQPDEVAACKDYLTRQVELIHPQVIVTLGRHSMARAFPGDKISLIHGQPRQINDLIYFPMYHPAAALHQPSLRGTLAEDFRKLRELLDGNLHAEEYQVQPDVEQLSFF